MNDPAIMAEIGKRLKTHRLRKNITQKDLAGRSGVSTLSVQNLERGRSVTLTTLISILRALRMLSNLDQFITEPPVSPIELLKLKGKSRQRSRRSSSKSSV